METKIGLRLAESFRPELVSLRRRMLGLSQIQLADRATIAQGTLSKIEQGLKAPSEEMIEKLASSLECPASFFCRTERVYGAPLSAHPMFRKPASTGQKTIDRLIAELNVRIGHIRTLIDNAEIQPELPFPQYDVDDYLGDAEEIARNVRRAWYAPTGPIQNLTEYAERAGCLITLSDMGDAAVDGVSYRVPGLPPLVFLNSKRPADRLRFSLAHEIGHLVMHPYPIPDMEEQANRFAAELLMPSEDIGPYLGNLTLEKAAYMKPFWKVSMAAIIVRAETLRRIDKNKAQWLWRQMSLRNYRMREPESLDFAKEEPSLVNALLNNLTGNLGYSPEELSEALCLRYEELASLYNLRGAGLRLVRSARSSA
ncbi:XRE family transcriptional regulator [Cupriavidus necator]|uniref:DNA-binding protein n=1 Tax=Cupriavidus necator TaxID=106590 RepID=A0A1K0I948_CUPNE|nr:DNA-binding protein [Cupriavidus necator]